MTSRDSFLLWEEISRLFPAAAVEKLSPYNFFGNEERITLQVNIKFYYLWFLWCYTFISIWSLWYSLNFVSHPLVSPLLFSHHPLASPTILSPSSYLLFFPLPPLVLAPLLYSSLLYSHLLYSTVTTSSTSSSTQRTKDYEDVLKKALCDLSKSYPVETHELLYNFRLEVILLSSSFFLFLLLLLIIYRMRNLLSFYISFFSYFFTLCISYFISFNRLCKVYFPTFFLSFYIYFICSTFSIYPLLEIIFQINFLYP